METYLKELAKKIGMELLDEQVNQFLKYEKMLLEKNKVMNLTAITDEKEIILKHFIDSLTIVPFVKEGKSLIDVGTGAGFPGIPVKIVKSDLSITLLDSLQKRLLFLEEVIQNLSLQKIQTVHGRAEDIAHQEVFREQFDFVTARAVANLSTLSELCLPFLKVGGTFIGMKAKAEDELKDAQKAITLLGGQVEKVHSFVLPESDIERNIILIRKVQPTSRQYPRKAGTPAKQPIQ